MDINVNLELLYFLNMYLSNGKEKFEELSSVVSELEISSSELSTIGNLSVVKNSVSLLKDVYNNTSTRVNNIKQVFQDNDEAAYRLFTYLDGELSEVFADYTDENGFDYVVDVDALLDIYLNSSLRCLKDESAPWHMYYYDEYTEVKENGEVVFNGERYTDDLLQYIQENYSGREAAVNSALVILQLASDRRVKYNYYHKGTGSDPETSTQQVLSGVDCNAFASWFIAQGTKEEFHWQSCEMLRNDDPKYDFISGPKIDFNNGQPGDIFINELPSGGRGAHVGVIIRNNPEKGTMIVAEAANPTDGIILCEVSYQELIDKNEGYHVRDMSKFYD